MIQTEFQFLTVERATSLAQLLSERGLYTEVIETTYGHDLCVEISLVYNGVVQSGSPILLQLDGRSYSHLMAGALNFKEESDEAMEIIVYEELDSQWCAGRAQQEAANSLCAILRDGLARY